MRPYNRSLHPDDYQFLVKWDAELRVHLQDMVNRGVPHREWHPHRFWEYASILQQLEELGVSERAEMIDLGSGASFFDPYLTTQFPLLCCTDNMQYGDISPEVEAQRRAFNISLPLWAIDIEDMREGAVPGWGGATDKFDVTMCISSIEHVTNHDKAMWELIRITKPGGYIFITSDYFRDTDHWNVSVSKHLQITPYTLDYVSSIPSTFGLDFVGSTDFEYKGDFVHNYSFVNLCLRKRAASTSAVASKQLADDNGKAPTK